MENGVKTNQPLALHHSWPIFERNRRFDLGAVFDASFEVPMDPLAFDVRGEALAAHGIGMWHCDLAGDTLTWTDGVYDIFGLPRGASVRREEAVAFYADQSCAVMERLRAHAVKHCRGFTVDVEIKPADQRSRWMRLIAAPIRENGRTVRLHGLKIAI
jgi:PAS domain-containing protein